MRSLSSSSTLLALAALGLAASALPVFAGTLLVPQQFPTIQAALNAAKPYDTVLVSAKLKGVYNESLTITTPHVVLQGVGDPILDGTGLGVPSFLSPFQPFIYPNGIEIRAGHVAVRGFVVQNTGDLTSYSSSPSAINVGYVTPDGQTDVSYSDVEISGTTVRSSVSGITISGLSGTDANAGGSPKFLKNYKLLGDVVTGSMNSGAGIINTSGALITGCQFTNNGGDGLDTSGSGITVTGNDSSANVNYGMALNAPIYNPAAHDPKNPNPAPSTAIGNSVHDNLRFGISATGTQTISANALTHNGDYGLSLFFADYSTVTGNSITGTTLAQFFGPSDDGTGIYADSGFSYPADTPGGFLTITGNNISNNAGDGVFLASVVSSTVSFNAVSGNAEVGIHLSDYTATTDGQSAGNAPNHVTGNLALHNTAFDARDDASASDTLTYPGYNTSVGDGGTTINVWTKNLFGKTDPANLSK